MKRLLLLAVIVGCGDSLEGHWSGDDGVSFDLDDCDDEKCTGTGSKPPCALSAVCHVLTNADQLQGCWELSLTTSNPECDGWSFSRSCRWLEAQPDELYCEGVMCDRYPNCPGPVTFYRSDP
jgi:hypothetical protein